MVFCRNINLQLRYRGVRMTSWEKALSTICEKNLQSDSVIEWILVGSVGSVLQRCEMKPGDIDLYVKHQKGVSQFAELFHEYSLDAKCEFPYGDKWYSSKDEPTFTEIFPSGFSWTKGRWTIEGVNVEVVHISHSAGIPDSLNGDGIWEGGQYIWSLYKNVKFGPYMIRTIPLEIQLESNMRRKRQDRVDSILAALKKHGYDRKLLSQALSSQHLAYFNSLGGENG